MTRRRARIQQHMSDLKMLADLFGEVADRVPRHIAVAERLDPHTLATIGVALPELTATCNALFEILAEETSAAACGASQRASPIKDQRSS
jgi:hypothetical protein